MLEPPSYMNKLLLEAIPSDTLIQGIFKEMFTGGDILKRAGG
jgi:hypothetical protein